MNYSAILLMSMCILLAKGAHLSNRGGVPVKDAQEGDIIYYFCSQSNVDCTPVKYDELASLPDTFDAHKDVFIVIHGWWDDYDSSSSTLIKDAVLESNDVNVVVVDWSSIASKDYFTAKDGVPVVGNYVGEFFLNLTVQRNVPVGSLKMAGHSLGAHVAGIAGALLGGGTDYIVGLDPASPFVDLTDATYTLDKSDSQFVQVVHTSAGKLGADAALGHADYFPNGGSSQPGCILDVVAYCAHQRSFEYYAETFKNNGFYARRCEDYDKFLDGTCDGSTSLMGGYAVDKSASGHYFLQTNKESPYAMGELQ